MTKKKCARQDIECCWHEAESSERTEKNNFKYILLWGEFLFHAKMSKFEGEKKFQSKTFEESIRKEEDETSV